MLMKILVETISRSAPVEMREINRAIREYIAKLEKEIGRLSAKRFELEDVPFQ